jgi:hypothetical protein
MTTNGVAKQPRFEPGDVVRVRVPDPGRRLSVGQVVRVVPSHGLAEDEVAVRTDAGEIGAILAEQLEKALPSHTGWAHAAGYRTGHYLDSGDPICGNDPRTFYGEMDLRGTQPADACGKCSEIVVRAGGLPKHRHVWMDAGSMGDERYMCRCGDHRTRPGGVE